MLLLFPNIYFLHIFCWFTRDNLGEKKLCNGKVISPCKDSSLQFDENLMARLLAKRSGKQQHERESTTQTTSSLFWWTQVTVLVLF